MKNITVTLPCNVGDTVYILEDKFKGKKVIGTEIISGIVDHFTIGQLSRPIASICTNYCWLQCETDEFYLTREAAETELKKEEEHK